MYTTEKGKQMLAAMPRLISNTLKMMSGVRDSDSYPSHAQDGGRINSNLQFGASEQDQPSNLNVGVSNQTQIDQTDVVNEEIANADVDSVKPAQDQHQADESAKP